MLGEHEDILELGGIAFDRRRGVLTSYDGGTIPLRPQSVLVLNALANRRGQPVSKDELISEVWGSVNVTDESLVQCIADIRRAIGDSEHKVIQTLPKVGYRLVAPTPAHAGKRTKSKLGYIGLAIAVLPVLAILAAVLSDVFSSPQTERKPSIAVLPFNILGDDTDQAYFCLLYTSDAAAE